MIDIIFLLGWTGLFFLSGLLVWKRVTAHIKVYLILIFNLFYLLGVFYLYPLIIKF